ncbi:class I SAM-dependent DNA methyltransferase [Sporosarcina cyprini]|uniref:class I SAM-dependent DNA methyltransferase n=1 Tax=Sporosarcina cyprini TaxID=2910523 RepID=UPI001EDE7519|nr:class I SAM-dependent methyltransferase [Sporosarcina cyprini]MCG3089731.1 class I SAM-dependent methyltransferase [Sporosarcina cyprini]
MGIEFNELFDQWAESYDSTVAGFDLEYKDVFAKYEEILENVAQRSEGFVVEFGVGTGNLTEKLLAQGLEVYGVEPSKGMREKVLQKLPDLDVVDGHFLEFPEPSVQVGTMVSTYAFHHLTDEEKAEALVNFHRLLRQNGRIVFADTVFMTELAKEQKIEESEQKGYFRLARDLRTEYYSTIPSLMEMFHTAGFDVKFEQQNDFVWLMDATKKER